MKKIIFLLTISTILSGCDIVSQNGTSLSEVPAINNETSPTVDVTPTNTPEEATATPTAAPTSTPIKPKVTVPSPDSPAMTIINTKTLGADKLNSYFYKTEITDQLYKRMYGKSYKKNCTVPLENLTYVKVLHYGFDKKTHIGELVVNTSIADTVLTIFKELYDNKYPIEKIALVDDYEADDNASMAANNTSCFNYRTIDGSTELSKHSLGAAIDINPLYNPYVRTINGKPDVLPKEGAAYADRSMECPYMIHKNDICYKTFVKYGFTWGGNWNSSKDYQHFQITVKNK